MRRSLTPAVLVAVAALADAGTALANTRANANSYINRVECISVPYVPGDCSGFIAGSGLQVWMNCWEGGPYTDGSGKWFDVTVRSGNGYGFTGDVPANSVSNQWTSSPRC